MKDKILRLITRLWAIVSFILLFTGGVTAVGYIAAIIIGGETGADIINFLYKQVFSVLIYINSVFIIVGLIKMELAGEKALTISNGKANKKSKKAKETE